MITGYKDNDELIEILEHVFEEEEGWYREIDFNDNHEILTKYCKTCTNNKECEEKKELMNVSIEGSPYHSPFFIPTYVFNPKEPVRKDSVPQSHIYCDQYVNPQRKLFEFRDDISEGLEKLVELSKDFFKEED